MLRDRHDWLRLQTNLLLESALMARSQIIQAILVLQRSESIRAAFVFSLTSENADKLGVSIPFSATFQQGGGRVCGLNA